MSDFIILAKGQNRQIHHQHFKISLKWQGKIDFDLVAFYKTKEHAAGIFSQNYAGGQLGNLHQFPYMQLSGDEGGRDGDNEEIIEVSRVDDRIEEMNILCLNYSNLSQNQKISFEKYNIRIEINQNGSIISVPLQDHQFGSIALISKIKNQNGNLWVEHDVKILEKEAFYAQIPGAQSLQFSSKNMLKNQGESLFLIQPKSRYESFDIQARLTWKSSVDLDLHCFYLPKNHIVYEENTGFFSSLFGKKTKLNSDVKRIYFGNKGSLKISPFIKLDQDAGVGDKGGDNEENIAISKTTELDALIFATNIFNKQSSVFSEYDGKVSVICGGYEIEVPLTSSQRGNWALIAMIDFRSSTPKVINLNEIQSEIVEYDAFLKYLKPKA